jgi:hypothetical protein
MIVAMETVHIDNGFFANKNGVEVPFLYATAALAFAAGGYGVCSLDQLFGIHKALEKRGLFYGAMLVAVAGSVWALTQRVPPAPEGGAGEAQPAGSEPDRTAA